MSFHVGQKVVCIKNGWDSLTYNEVGPAFRSVYTIRTIDAEDGDAMLRFEEIVNEVHNYREGQHECQFWARWFRPVIERKTDISIFTAMLKPSKVEA